MAQLLAWSSSGVGGSAVVCSARMAEMRAGGREQKVTKTGPTWGPSGKQAKRLAEAVPERSAEKWARLAGRVPASVELGARVLDHLGPARLLVADEVAELGRRAGPDLAAHLGQAL